MANRVFLRASHSSDPQVDYGADAEIIVGASYMLPVLWCSIFTEKEWLTLLGRIEAPCLHVDTQELWAMFDGEQFDRWLRQCPRAFDTDAADDWAVLLNQSGMKYNAVTRQVSFNAQSIAHDLHGYKWMRPVPWQES